MSKEWYKVCARNFQCNNHPRQPKELAKLFGEYTGMTEINSRHLIDRIRHLAMCLEEPENLTLFRLQPGKNQNAPTDR